MTISRAISKMNPRGIENVAGSRNGRLRPKSQWGRRSFTHVSLLAACLWAAAFAAASGQTPQNLGGSPVLIMALGDSLTAGYGLPEEAAFPNVLERRLAKMGFSVKIVNAGVSGDTASGGLERLAWSIPQGAQIAIIELGANDMLRAIDPKITREAMDKILQNLQQRKIFPIIAGMRAQANWGPAYTQDYDAIYLDLARKYGAPLYPFFLQGVIDDKGMTLPDGLHPNARGVERIVDGFAPFLAKVLSEKFPQNFNVKD